MKRLLFLFLVLACCTAVCQDLAGKTLTFPVESNTAYVKLTPAVNKIFFTATVCLRFFSDLSREQSLFSLSTPSHDNGLLLYKKPKGAYDLWVANQFITLLGLPDELNEWNSLCGTWDSGTGLGQLWVNGKRSARKALSAGGSIAGTPSIILGQEQDSYGGGFDKAQSFVGEITDVHMWDYVLHPHIIQGFMNYVSFTPGNVLSWRALEYTRQGYVVVEDSQIAVMGIYNTTTPYDF
ncbi:serum amyloid P-component-like [Megalops cyprinoides]|uniref:serum amyloid P-component-like n=1 Tax=Megalops cyprinoides TaxID=118141 RepID=UPI001863F6AB|nr:serum amyloid P-component-like [Megalops cyprinoides]